jgi:hypothetical protein
MNGEPHKLPPSIKTAAKRRPAFARRRRRPAAFPLLHLPRCLLCVCLVRPKYLAACRMLGIAGHTPHYSQLLIGLLHARTLHARAHRCFRGDESQASRLGLLYRQPMSLSHTRLSRTRQAKLGLGLNYLDFDSSVSPDCTASQSAPRRKQAMSRDKESAAQGLLVLTLLLF